MGTIPCSQYQCVSKNSSYLHTRQEKEKLMSLACHYSEPISKSSKRSRSAWTGIIQALRLPGMNWCLTSSTPQCKDRWPKQSDQRFCNHQQEQGSMETFFFWTMLRSSLQLWQSWSCAKVVIVRQLDQNDWPATSKSKPTNKQKQNKPQQPRQHQKNPHVPDQSMKRWNRWNRLTLSIPRCRRSIHKNPGSHNLFSIL